MLRQAAYGHATRPGLPVVCGVGAQPVRVILVGEPGAPDGYDLALVCTDLDSTPAELVERYADRWSVEVLFEESRLVAGGRAWPQSHPPRGPAHRPLRPGLLCVSLVVCWYAQHGQPAADLAAYRARAPWYRTKHAVSLAGMLTALRRELLAAQFLSSRLVTPTLDELLHAQAARAATAHEVRNPSRYLIRS